MPTSPPEQVRLFELQTAEAIIKLGGDEMAARGWRAALVPPPVRMTWKPTALACQILGSVHDRESAQPDGRAGPNTPMRGGNHYPPGSAVGLGRGSCKRWATAKARLSPTGLPLTRPPWCAPRWRTSTARIWQDGKIGGKENWISLDGGIRTAGFRIAAKRPDVLKSAGGRAFQPVTGRG